jgi:hypothetical protein
MKRDIVSKDEFLNEIKEWSSSWDSDIKKSIDRNITLFASSIGTRGEYLASLISGKMGTGSGGSGFDLSDKETADESKIACLVQPKVCNKCVDDYCKKNKIKKDSSIESKNRIIFFYENCPTCSGNSFKYISDSRWGIDAKAGITYKDKMDTYWLQTLEPSEYDSKCRTFIYKCFKISAKNENFSDYLLNQKENGSKDNCNLLPFSIDFYRFSPIKVVEVMIELKDGDSVVTDIFWNLSNIEIEKMPSTGIYAPSLTKDELKDVLENLGVNVYSYTDSKTKSWSKNDKILSGYKSEIDYLKNLVNNSIKDNNLADYLSIRKKSLGKDRGITTRSL